MIAVQLYTIRTMLQDPSRLGGILGRLREIGYRSVEVAGLGPKTAASLINRHGHIEQFPAETLTKDNIERALLFKNLATLRTDAPLFRKVDKLRWRGATPSFAAMMKKIGDSRLETRIKKLQER